MNHRIRGSLTEGGVLFISILKWVVLATAVGAIVGVGTTVFLKGLNAATFFVNSYRFYFLALPVALFASAWLVKKLAPDAEGHGTEKVIEAVHKHGAHIKPAVVPVKAAATIVTLACGGSAGKEGPCAQIGAGLSSLFADLLKFDAGDRRKLVICGISAGFAAVFGTPIAGSIFGVEVLVVGSLLYDVLLPSFVAGITSYQISSALGIQYFYHPWRFTYVFSESFFFKVALLGILFGICSMLLIEGMRLVKNIAHRLKLSPPTLGLIGGATLIVLAIIFSGDYLGLGLDTIQASIEGAAAPWYAFLVKIFATSVTLNLGGSGGIVTPIFFIGATSGAFFAKLFGLSVATAAALGMVSVLAGAANAPIAASIMSVELFGPQLAPYATVACVISFLMTGHRSVYPSQLLGMQKSSTLKVELGTVIDECETEIELREKSLIGFCLAMARKIRDHGPHKDHNGEPPGGDA
jgi:H+/Cl- antiporter ClcA